VVASRTLVTAAAVVALIAAAWRLPASVHALNNRAAAAGESKPVPAARLYGIEVGALERLRRLLPRGAYYTVVRPGAGAPVGELAFPGIVADYLLPRRVVESGPRVRWVVAYRSDPRSAGLQLARVVDLGGDVRVGLVAR
jgi:hypothetical protein